MEQPNKKLTDKLHFCNLSACLRTTLTFAWPHPLAFGVRMLSPNHQEADPRITFS